MKFKIPLLCTIAMSAWIGFSPILALTPTTETKWKGFLHSPTKAAKSMLNKFTDEELNEIFSEYTANKSQDELRTLWIIKEKEARRADQVAADRLFFVFLAITLIGILLFTFVYRIYQMQRRLENEE